METFPLTTTENTNDNVEHAKAGKIRSVAETSRPLHLSQATKTKEPLKSSIILPVRAHFCSILLSVFYVKYNGKIRNTIRSRNIIPVYRHFTQDKYRFNKHAKTNTNKSKKSFKEGPF